MEILKLIHQAADSGKLDLCEQQLMTIPTEIFQLTELEELYLDNNQLTALPPEITQFTQLRVLSLTGNALATLPTEIAQLANLKWLYLANNQLNRLPLEITQLSQLKVLSLDSNQITALPKEIIQLPHLQVLSCYKNPLSFPPPEIIVQGTQEILTYLRQPNKQPQWMAKFLLVGEAGVGKTSLLHQLRGETFNNKEESTFGIAIDTWALKHPSQADVMMQLRTWDFGGQTIYQATHQFFLTNKALFILVWNARLGYEQGKLAYWLETIQARAPDSPIVLVATHIDKGYDAVLPFAELKHKYPQIVDHKCYKVSNETGDGIDTLRQAIAETTAQLPLMGEQWPSHWTAVANAIRDKKENSLTPHQLQELMTNYSLASDELTVLTTWLHELGELLYFQDNEELKNVVILKPQWVTEHISRVLTSQEVLDKKGILTDSHREQLWADLNYEMREHFLNLMEQFDLSYQALEDRHTSFIVECLPYDPPDYQTPWNAMQEVKEIRMTYELTNMNHLPPGIPTWFIARSHRFTTNLHWRYGALLADNATTRQHLGLIRAFPEERRIELAVRGPFPHSFFAVLHDSLELTLDRFPGLQIQRKIPCLGHTKKPNCPYEFDYDRIKAALNQKVSEIQCQETFEPVSVPKLLLGLDWRTQDDLVNQIKQESQNLQNAMSLMQRNFIKTLSANQQEFQCPYVFTLRTEKAQWWRPFAARKIILQLHCQHEDLHETQEGGCYHIHEFDKWSHFLVSHLSKLIVIFNYSQSGGIGTIGTIEKRQRFQDDLAFMNQLVQKYSPLENRVEGTMLRNLCILLNELDPKHDWGGLERVVTEEGQVLWLCEKHAQNYQSKI